MKSKIKNSFHLIAPFLIVLIGSLDFYSCTDKSITPFLTVDPQTVLFNASKSQKSISIKSHPENWTETISPVAEWITTQKEENSLIIQVEANTGFQSRKGEIIISAGELTEKVEIEQLGEAKEILLSDEIFTLSSDGNEIRLQVVANIDYEIIIPEEHESWVEWISSRDTIDELTREHLFQIGWNTSQEERRGEIIFKETEGELEKKAIIIQKAQEGYSGGNQDHIKDDILVKVDRGYASSAQQGEGIEKSFDGDMSTLYHSSWNNSGADYFPITLEYYFEDEASIDYFIYYPRLSGNNGNFKEVEIWTATHDNPEPEKLLDYDFQGSSSPTRVVLPESLQNPSLIRFVIRSGAGDGQGFASCAEMEFYRFNPDNFDPLAIFTDMTCSELQSGIGMKEIEEIANPFYRNIAFHMYQGTYPEEFRIQEYQAWPHPDEWAQINKTSTLSLLDNPTGMSFSKGEEVVVFVGETTYPISLKVQDLGVYDGDGYNNASQYPLSPGVNKLKMRNKGLGYIFYHTPDHENAPPVVIHFASGKVNGYYDSQKHQPEDWTRLLENAVDPFFDVVGAHAHLTFPTEDYRTYTGDKGPELIEMYDDLVFLEKDFMGLIKYDRPTINRAYFHAMYHSFMYATAYRTAYNVSGEGVKRTVMDPQTLRRDCWGPAHEMGHTFQTRPGFRWHGMTEVTNNVHSLYVQTQWGNPSRIETEPMGRYNNRYEKAYHNSFVKNIPHPGEEDVFCKLVSLWQLQLYFSNTGVYEDFYKDFYEKVRTSSDRSTPGEQQLEFVRMVCDLTELDLTDFFTKWGYLSPFDESLDDYGSTRFQITRHQIDQLLDEIRAKSYPKPEEKIEYICDSNWEIFRDRSSVILGSAEIKENRITMKDWQNVVAYEVYEDDHLIFVSNQDSFTLEEPSNAQTEVFAIGYDGSRTKVEF